jgi:hypothetical protein
MDPVQGLREDADAEALALEHASITAAPKLT